jgi:hypothetical protein
MNNQIELTPPEPADIELEQHIAALYFTPSGFNDLVQFFANSVEVISELKNPQQEIESLLMFNTALITFVLKLRGCEDEETVTVH